MTEFETVIGLEVHAELKTRTKMYCSCENRFGAEPNTLVCPICMGYPGALPVLNKKAAELAVRAGLAFNCQIDTNSFQDRKNYFYPDLPKSYQISQSDRPLCRNGFLDILLNGTVRRIRINRIHIEEDAGKLLHDPEKGVTLADYNRCGVPLIEIVTEPDMNSPAEAKAFLETVRATLKALDISDCKMEEGSVRCDVNVSVRQKGSSEPGTRCEMKNINSFSAAVRGIEYESARQISLINSGGTVSQETRRWDDLKGFSTVMRTKENAMDYRFFPEPDLGRIALSDKLIENERNSLTELPGNKLIRYTTELGLSEQEARIIAFDPDRAWLFDESLLYERGKPKTICNFIVGEVTRFISDNKCTTAQTGLTPSCLACVAELFEEGKISSSGAKKLLAHLLEKGGIISQIIDELGLEQNSDPAEAEQLVKQVIAENPQSVEEYRKGKSNAINFIIGTCMKRSKGRSDPALIRRLAEKSMNDQEE